MRIRRYIGLCAVVPLRRVGEFCGPYWGRDRRDAGKDRRQAEIIAPPDQPATASAMEGMNSPDRTPRAIAGVVVGGSKTECRLSSKVWRKRAQGITVVTKPRAPLRQGRIPAPVVF